MPPYHMHRDSRENCSLLKEEVEGLRKKLERMEKMKEDLVNMEHEKEVRVTNNRNDNRSNVPVQTRAFSLFIFRGCQRGSKHGKIWASLPDSTSGQMMS